MIFKQLIRSPRASSLAIRFPDHGSGIQRHAEFKGPVIGPAILA
jgi:hypothetical protein